jgi:hypothetical protein
LKDYYFILENGKTLFCRHNIPGEISTILFEAKKDTAIYSKSCGFSRGIPLIVLDRDRNVIYSEPNDDNRRATYYKMPEDGYIIVNHCQYRIYQIVYTIYYLHIAKNIRLISYMSNIKNENRLSEL